MQLDYDVQIMETDAQIYHHILRAMADHLNQFTYQLQNNVRPLIQQTIRNLIMMSDVYSEFQHRYDHGLLAHLGLKDPIGDMDIIIKTMQDSVVVNIGKFGIYHTNIVGTWSFTAIPSDYQDLFNNPNSHYTSISQSKEHPGRATEFYWLKWLLLWGDMTLSDYEQKYTIVFKRGEPSSRTDLALMVKTNDASLNWKMPAAFAGTIDNNFITRTLDRYTNIIGDEIFRIFKQSV